MKNYIIGILLVIIFIIGSLFFKYFVSNNILFTRFPVNKIESDTPSLYLFIFFSKKNCHDCLEIIDVLNKLPPRFKVTGVIPDSEIDSIKEIRFHTGAAFTIEPQRKFKRFVPRYMPTIIGASAMGEIYFVLPGVPGEKEYLQDFLNSMYYKLLSHLSG
jgi:hypothetical protein